MPYSVLPRRSDGPAGVSPFVPPLNRRGPFSAPVQLFTSKTIPALPPRFSVALPAKISAKGQ